MSGVLEDLSDEECYLWALMQDPSGLDLAEFTWYEPENKDGCFRAWPFQWTWWRTTDPLQIDQCARSVGKSLSISVRMFAFPFLFPGQEALITAPELVHLEPIANLVERRFYDTRLGREMLPHGRSAVTHRPFMMNFLNGARIFGRIPQKDGRGVKGSHPIWLELDEAQDYPEPGWMELIETLKRGFEGAVWRAHGVTRGVRDKFYEFTQERPDNDWTVHRMVAMHRPNWTDQERKEKIKQYGSRDHPDYRRNVLGLHGDATNPIFVLHRLMQTVDSNETSEYNSEEYLRLDIKEEWLLDMGCEITDVMDFPVGHKTNYKDAVYWAGMDVGFTQHPSEILVFVEYTPTKGKPSTLKLLTRVHLERISHDNQVEAILHVIDFYRPRALAMDKTGLGLPLFQAIQGKAEKNPSLNYVLDIIKGYNFSAKILVDFDGSVILDEYKGDMVKDAGIQRNVLEYSTDVLRELVDAKRIQLPWDTDLIGEFQGQTWTNIKGTQDMYGRRIYCVDEETQAFTRDGWRSQGDLRVGEEVLTLNPATMLSEWQPLEAVSVFEGPHEMVHMENTTHSSLSTLDHRWLVERYDTHNKTRKVEWRTTEKLGGLMAIPRCAPPAWANPPKYDDDFVELVAWTYTEGCLEKTRSGEHSTISLVQSHRVNPAYVDRIRGCLRRLAGASGRLRDGYAWHEAERKTGITQWRLGRDLSAEVRAVLDPSTKAVLPAFLNDLTPAQLRLFIETSVDADGTRTQWGMSLCQKEEARARSFEHACVLAGLPTNTRRAGTAKGMWRVAVLSTTRTTPAAMAKAGVGQAKYERVIHEGIAWCPTTANGTWLARRNGSVYYTGNSKGKFHALDASRMAALGHKQYAIEKLLKQEPNEAVFDAFVSF